MCFTIFVCFVYGSLSAIAGRCGCGYWTDVRPFCCSYPVDLWRSGNATPSDPVGFHGEQGCLLDQHVPISRQPQQGLPRLHCPLRLGRTHCSLRHWRWLVFVSDVIIIVTINYVIFVIVIVTTVVVIVVTFIVTINFLIYVGIFWWQWQYCWNLLWPS